MNILELILWTLVLWALVMGIEWLTKITGLPRWLMSLVVVSAVVTCASIAHRTLTGSRKAVRMRDDEDHSSGH